MTHLPWKQTAVLLTVLAALTAGPVRTRADDSITEPSFRGSAPGPESPLTLWWRKPGADWRETMVLGNGRLGAMLTGGVREENIWLNEDTLWSGENVTSTNSQALAALPEIRRLLAARREPEAHNLCAAKVLGVYNESYLPLGNLTLRFPRCDAVQDYRRTLDLRTGVATVQYQHDGVRYRRETFVSYPDQALVMRLQASQPGQISFVARLTSPLRSAVTARDGILRLSGRCPIHVDPSYVGNRVVYDEGPDPKGMRFVAELQVIPEGGTVTIEDGRLVVAGCHAVTLHLVAATSYNGFDKSPSRQGRDPAAICARQRAAIRRTAYVKLLARHLADFRSLMDRVSLKVPPTQLAQRPTDERVGPGFKPEDLPALTALYYQFGRYLLVSSSRPNAQPANLQGIWNRTVNALWSCNYTMNCNANFNYLGVEAAHLAELHAPFIRMIQEWSVDGQRVAKDWYGCRGWVGHHNIDLWRAACPVAENPVYAMFPCGSAWACQDLWEHYAFTRDEKYLRAIWPTLRGNAEFFLDFLVKDPKTGYFVTMMDTNFENFYRRPDGSITGLCQGPTPSNQMVRELFRNCIQASTILGRDAGLRSRLETTVVQLPPTVVNPQTGELQEYLDPAYAIAKRELHELLSCWGLIWGNQITPGKTPELCAAIRKYYESPDQRPWVTGMVGSWQGAFPANCFARMGDGDRVMEILAAHFRTSVSPNLTAHFLQYGAEWEIDGNLGNMAAIGELLLQSHNGEIALLPALPKDWPAGSVKGLKARGNVTVDLTWQDGKVTAYQLRSPHPRPVRLRLNGNVVTVRPDCGPALAKRL